MPDPIASVADFRAVAQQRLPRFQFDYIDGGSYDEVTLRRNLTGLVAAALRQRVLRDVSAIDMSTTLFGQRYALPLALGPMGLAGLTARRGEAQAARDCGRRRAALPFDRFCLFDRRGAGRILYAVLVPALQAARSRFCPGHDRKGRGRRLPGAGLHNRPADNRRQLSRHSFRHVWRLQLAGCAATFRLGCAASSLGLGCWSARSAD